MRNSLITCDHVWTNARLATMERADNLARSAGEAGRFALGVRGTKIAAIAPMNEVGELCESEKVTDVAGAWITPGFVDCHTHLIYGGSRSREIEMRRRGVSYADIAKQGGGIVSTVRATREMTEEQLIEAALPRLDALLAEGVTTVEIKSGYGLTLADELKMLRAARQLSSHRPVRVVTTLLAAHALPPEYAGRADDYIALVCNEIIPAATAEHLVDAVDVFCETVAFSVAQCERVFDAAARHGLRVKGHVEQLSNLGGSQLAARFHALSVDHLEHLDAEGVRCLAGSGTVAILLPGAYYFLNEVKKPPVELLRAAGVPMAVASDLNPGTSPLASIRLAMNMASTLFGLSADEILRGVTSHAAAAIGLGDCVGSLAVGHEADLLVWNIDDPVDLIFEFGARRLEQRIFGGRQNAHFIQATAIISRPLPSNPQSPLPSL